MSLRPDPGGAPPVPAPYVPPVYKPPVTPNKTGQYQAPRANPVSVPSPSTPAIPAAPIVATNATPGLNLGTDVPYQQFEASSQKQLAEMLAGQQQQRGNYLAQEGLKEHTLGQQYQTNQRNDLDSYGARGIAHSSLYGDQINNDSRRYDASLTGLQDQRNQFLTGLLQAKQAFQDRQLNAQQSAMAAAAARQLAFLTAGQTPTTSAVAGSNPNIKGAQ